MISELNPFKHEHQMASEDIARQADIIVGCYDNWRNMHDVIRFNTPGGRGIVDGVAFVRGETLQPDWRIIFNNADFDSDGIAFEGAPNRTLFAVAEPPSPVYWPWHDGQVDGTIVLTCDPGAKHRPGNETRHYVTEASLTRSWSVYRSYDFLKNTNLLDKPKPLSWICSNLALLKGHRRRLAFLDKVKGEIPFDHFGWGFRPIVDKWGALAPYRYSIAYENNIGDYLFTEKLNDCFVSQTMPIYIGSPRITDFFPAESLVIIDPDDPDALRIIKDVIASDLWIRNREAIDEAKRRVLDDLNVFNRLAAYIRRHQDQPMPPRRINLKNIGLDYTMLE